MVGEFNDISVEKEIKGLKQSYANLHLKFVSMKPQQTEKHCLFLARVSAVKSDQNAVKSISQQLKSNKLCNLMGKSLCFL